MRLLIFKRVILPRNLLRQWRVLEVLLLDIRKVWEACYSILVQNSVFVATTLVATVLTALTKALSFGVYEFLTIRRLYESHLLTHGLNFLILLPVLFDSLQSAHPLLLVVI